MPKSASLVAVQMQYRLEDYRSAEAFRERVLGVMRAVRQRAPKGDLLVVFPEDVGLGLIFTQDFERVQSAKTMVEAGLRLMERYQINAFAGEGGFAGATRTLLRTLSPFVERVYHEVFSEAARVGSAWVVAGSAPIAQGECVHNVCYTYNPKGERVLVQRKINLVPLEQEAGLEPVPCAARTAHSEHPCRQAGRANLLGRLLPRTHRPAREARRARDCDALLQSAAVDERGGAGLGERTARRRAETS
jgi:hypothetical protein